MVPFRKGADGVVARESRFAVRFETFACERPPRLREIRWLRDFFIERAATPPHEEGNTPTLNSLVIHSQLPRPRQIATGAFFEARPPLLTRRGMCINIATNQGIKWAPTARKPESKWSTEESEG